MRAMEYYKMNKQEKRFIQKKYLYKALFYV